MKTYGGSFKVCFGSKGGGMTKTSDVIVLVMLEFCVGVPQVRYLDRRSQDNNHKVRDLTSSHLLLCAYKTSAISFLESFISLFSDTDISYGHISQTALDPVRSPKLSWKEPLQYCSQQ
jgi:hypothetical protein